MRYGDRRLPNQFVTQLRFITVAWADRSNHVLSPNRTGWLDMHTLDRQVRHQELPLAPNWRQAKIHTKTKEHISILSQESPSLICMWSIRCFRVCPPANLENLKKALPEGLTWERLTKLLVTSRRCLILDMQDMSHQTSFTRTSRANKPLRVVVFKYRLRLSRSSNSSKWICNRWPIISAVSFKAKSTKSCRINWRGRFLRNSFLSWC